MSIPIVFKIGTTRFRRAIVDLIPSEQVKRIRDIIDVLHKTSVEIIETKKEALREGDQALAAQVGRGKDIISILSTIPLTSSATVRSKDKCYLVKGNMKASSEDKLSDTELLGQVT